MQECQRSDEAGQREHDRQDEQSTFHSEFLKVTPMGRLRPRSFRKRAARNKRVVVPCASLSRIAGTLARE